MIWNDGSLLSGRSAGTGICFGQDVNHVHCWFETSLNLWETESASRDHFRPGFTLNLREVGEQSTAHRSLSTNGR